MKVAFVGTVSRDWIAQQYKRLRCKH
jgi:hypothetical protein